MAALANQYTEKGDKLGWGYFFKKYSKHYENTKEVFLGVRGKKEEEKSIEMVIFWILNDE